MSDRPCESCGRRGVLLVEIGFGDGAPPFTVCVPCAETAIREGCSMTEVQE